jgi:PleD family two-component response regulator
VLLLLGETDFDIKDRGSFEAQSAFMNRRQPLELRVLVVDDSETMRRLLRSIIDSRQWVLCGEAENGSTGVKKFQELKPDLVLIDLALPDMNGIEVAHRMSSLDRSVPLVLFTVLDVEGLESAARKAGICQVVSKAQVWDLIKGIEVAVAQYRRQKGQVPEISG